MFSFFSNDKGKRRDDRDDRLLPITDFKIGPFKIGSASSTPNSEYAYSYTAITPSDDSADDIPLSMRGSPQRYTALTLDAYRSSNSPPPGYRPPSYYSTLIGATHRRARCLSLRCKLLAIAAVVLPCLYIFCYITFRPPNYIVLPPENYVETLKDTLTRHVPSQASRQALLEHLAHIEHPDLSANSAAQPETSPTELTYPNPTSVVPSTIWSSDGKPAPSAWFTKWSQMGFDPKFLDDAGAEKWIQSNWADTSVKHMWDSMPRFILKADLLRYLLLLNEGGTWSDMDTVPLMHRTNWTKDAVPLASLLPEDSGIFGRATLASSRRTMVSATPEPVRAIIGIENDPNENRDPRNFFERWRLLPMRRHRPLQFVQWTLHSAPNHPIMLDVLRRVLRASETYHAYELDQQREANSDGWGWGEKSAEVKKEQARLREAHTSHPWDAFSMSWKWQAGHWRWGWDQLSIEEWTGPAVFTDAVVSYLYASAGVRPEDLSRLKQPVQIRDVIIVPSVGFNQERG